MVEKYPQNRNEICEFLKTAKTVEDFIVAQILISNIFCNADPAEIKKILYERDNFYTVTFENIFGNQNFIEALGKVLEQFKVLKEKYKLSITDELYVAFGETEIKNKKIILSALTASTSVLVNMLPYLSDKNLDYTARRLRSSVEKLKGIFDNKYSSSEIFNIFYSVFNRRVYPKITFPLEIKNINHYFKQQKASQVFINLVARLSFKNTRLNNLFKVIEKNKLEGKFSLLSILNINNFVRTETYREKNFVDQLGNFFSDPTQLNIFIEKFKNDQNEENVFNLIEITTREFKSKKTIEEDLIRTINNGNKIREEMEAYGVNNFEAFSGEICEGNIEWSNKVLINCYKLFGVISGLPKAVDKSWIMDVCVKEFANWTSSVHKILNKYDIDDDWEKISKYLVEESNRVEWKSTFFTPTKTGKDDPIYQAVSRKTFSGIVKTILGMMNTDGGVIIIGLVEKPEEIVVEYIKNSVFLKNGKCFLDISKELASSKMDLDGIKRKIQDSLRNETLTSTDSFNGLWGIQPVNIKSEDGNGEISIYKIEVNKSTNPIFSIKPDKNSEDVGIDIRKSENIWVSILKRADARTIYGDPRKILDTINKSQYTENVE